MFSDQPLPPKKPRKGTKSFRCEEHDGICTVPLTDAAGKRFTWLFPASVKEMARSLWWPLHIRRLPDGKPYLSRKMPAAGPDGRTQRNVPAHRLFAGHKYPDLKPDDLGQLRIRAKNGDYLDWTGDNICVPVVDSQPISDSQRELAIQRNIRESSRKQVHWFEDGESGYEDQPVGIDPDLTEYWERKLAEDMVTSHCIMALDEARPLEHKRRRDFPDEN